MSDAASITLLQQLPAILTALGVIVTAVLSYSNRGKLQVTSDRLNDVHDAVNGGWADLKQKLNTAVDALDIATKETTTLKAEILNLKQIISARQAQQRHDD